MQANPLSCGGTPFLLFYLGIRTTLALLIFSSVNRLDNFLKCLETILLSKVAQIFNDCLGFFEKFPF